MGNLFTKANVSDATTEGYVYNKKSNNPTKLEWSSSVIDPSSIKLKRGDILVEVRACGLNFMDANVSKMPSFMFNSFYHGKCAGLDVSGVVIESESPKFVKGDAVMGMSESYTGGCCTRIIVNDQMMSKKPVNLSFLQASVIPTAFMTSQTALVEYGKLKKGDKVIVVGASGGVGMAGIIIARSIVGPDGVVAAICGTDNVPYIESLGICTPGLVLDYRQPNQIVGPDSPLHSHSFDVVYDTITSSFNSTTNFQGKGYDEVLQPYLNTDTGFIVAVGGFNKRLFSFNYLLGIDKKFKFCGLAMRGVKPNEMSELTLAFESNVYAPIPAMTTVGFNEEELNHAFGILYQARAKGKYAVNVKNGDVCS